ncbi:MAG: hypothetical protein R3C19_22105 [Planctomycetaceae bacterium]
MTIVDLAFSHDGRSLFVLQGLQAVRELNPVDGSVVGVIPFAGNTCSALAVSPNGRWLATGVGGGSDVKVQINDLRSDAAARWLTGHRRFVRALCFSADSRILASAGEDLTIRLWDVESGDVLHTLSGSRQDERALAFAPDGRTLVSGSEAGSLRFWHVETGRQLFCADHHHVGGVRRAVFSRNGSTLATIAGRGRGFCEVALWRIP